ncbi:MAG TPA: M20/M25/M40 family metallo-hydrolase, partial [Polyangiaceae bacterium]|nr:M20/M25/M40 family metallo-hydrolase [Polyangiaceae bacterium]
MVRPLLVATALVLAVVLGVAPLAPTAPVPSSAPATAFSAERAMKTLAVLAAKPHPTGTAADDAVREYVAGELEGLGFDVDVEDTTGLTEVYARRWGIPVVAAHVRNIVARRRGTAPGPALMLMAHYDSRELAPGASDDGYGTVTLLETARALAASPPLRHDVLLLLTEGEEEGLLGARAFLEESPAAHDVGLVLNFEARGDRGPVMMFQTSEHAGGLVDVLASVAPHVAATSLSQEVYRRMPNDTDLTPWLRAGFPAMNFANVDGFGRYHQPTDTVANADPATVQHHGSYALALTRAFADRETLAPPASGDEVYFTAGTVFVHYAAREATTLAALAVGLLGIALGVGGLRRRFRAGAVVAGAGVSLLAVVAAGVVAAGLWWAADRASGGALATQQVRDALRKMAVAAFVLLGAGVAWGVFALSRRRVRTDYLAVGALLWWALLAAATAVALPGVSFLFVWPLMAAAAAWCLRVAVPSLDGEHPAAIAAHLVAAMAAIILLVPVALQVGVAFGPSVAPALAAVGALAATAAVPAMKCFGSPRRWIVPTLLTGGAVAGIFVPCSVPAYDASSPRPDSLLYVEDADHGTASWVSFDDAPDAWTSRVLSGAKKEAMPSLFPRSKRALLQAGAPVVPLDPPRIGVLADTRVGATRSLRLRVMLPPGT